MEQPFANFGKNIEIDEDENGNGIIRNAKTGASIKFSDFIDIAGGLDLKNSDIKNVSSISTEEIVNVYDAIISPGDAAELQSAIDNAAAGDRIAVPPGAYQSDITIDKGVIIEGLTVQEVRETGNNIFATDGLSAESVIIGDPNSTTADIKLDHGGSAIQGLRLSNIGLTAGGPGIQTVKGQTNDDPRLHDFVFDGIYGVGLGLGDFLIDLSNAAEGTIRNPRGHDLGSGIRLETEDGNVNYGLISLFSPRIDINKDDGSEVNAGLRFDAVSGGTIDGIYIDGSPVHIGSQNSPASNFYGINARRASFNVSNLRAEGPETLVKARESTVGYAHLAHFSSDVTIDDDNRNIYAVSETAGIVDKLPSDSGATTQITGKALLARVNGPWQFRQAPSLVYDDFGDNGFSSRDDRFRGYAQIESGRTGLFQYREPWKVQSGSPSVSSSQLTIPGGNSQADEAQQVHMRFDRGYWRFEFANAATAATGNAEFAAVTDPNRDNAIYVTNSVANDEWRLYQQEAGARTELDAYTGATTDTNTHKLDVNRDYVGNISVYLDGTEILSGYNDTSFTTRRVGFKTGPNYDVNVLIPSLEADPI